eukprot:gnl/MRDRNA2_/MRDRNA2_107861_c0_seq1.p1 gnl/MRDRNA2_/MRDRNA2_107861_c0~~gnl/MRDRNA2_/MRDRNA2_107861_c0_seq1.p1  ORF type:complete len:154 (+),score=15.68 gnl/MRDRNA2_/MRDRNA2_107861_c0_seq1:58-462(+)
MASPNSGARYTQAGFLQGKGQHILLALIIFLVFLRIIVPTLVASQVVTINQERDASDSGQQGEEAFTHDLCSTQVIEELLSCAYMTLTLILLEIHASSDKRGLRGGVAAATSQGNSWNPFEILGWNLTVIAMWI